MEIFVLKENDESLDHDELVTKLREQCPSLSEDVKIELVSGDSGHWRSVEDWAASTCRSYHKLDRKLVTAQDDFIVITKLLMQTACRTITGDSQYLLSDLLELQNNVRKCRRQGLAPDYKDGVIGEAAKNYSKFMKQCGLIDKWELVKTCLSCIEDNHDQVALVLYHFHESDFDIIEQMTSNVTPVNIVNGSLVLSEKVSINSVEKCEAVKKQSVSDVVMLLASYLRLLLCTKEELSLARAVTSSGLLTADQFTAVRREADKSSLPMYQTIVSFVRQMDLGGKSYAPGEANTLHDLLPSLSQFNIIMEKLQTRLEETQGAEAAVMSVVTCLKGWLAKQGVIVSSDMVDMIQTLSQEVTQRQTSWKSTPARGRMGRPAIKLLAGLVDLLGCLHVETKEDLGNTPARQSKLVASFRTPQPSQELDPDDEIDDLVKEKSLADRLGAETKVPGIASIGTPTARPTYPRFKSGNDFTEGSPALLRSADRDGGGITGGRTLMARASGGDVEGSPVTSVESTRRILQEVKEREEQENIDKVEEVKKQVKKTKRCLNKEVDEIVREKMGLKRKAETKAGNDSPPKQKQAKRKKIATPKGQKKLTSFFTK